jgi:hypothetical protein
LGEGAGTGSKGQLLLGGDRLARKQNCNCSHVPVLDVWNVPRTLFRSWHANLIPDYIKENIHYRRVTYNLMVIQDNEINFITHPNMSCGNQGHN